MTTLNRYRSQLPFQFLRYHHFENNADSEKKSELTSSETAERKLGFEQLFLFLSYDV